MRNGLLPILLAALVTAPVPAFAQTAAAAGGLTFDVASVRPAAPIDRATMLATLQSGRRPESMRVDGLRATYTYMSLKELIANGYKVRTYQVDGPDWLATDRFDIVAKLPAGAAADDAPAMLQALLAERFKLAAHLETKEHPVLGLMVGKAGPKLKAVAAATPAPLDPAAPLKAGQTRVDTIDGPMILTRNGNGTTTYDMGPRGTFTLKVDGDTGTMHMSASGMTMKGFAMMLTSLGGGNGRQVVDMSGLPGNYELAVDFSLNDLVMSLRDSGIDLSTGGGGNGNGAGPSDPGGDSTVSDALGKLGLKLEKSKAMVEQLVVDHVEKSPTDN